MNLGLELEQNSTIYKMVLTMRLPSVTLCMNVCWHVCKEIFLALVITKIKIQINSNNRKDFQPQLLIPYVKTNKQAHQ